ncbi:MAG: cation:proton antiporter [Candidatus Cloacimonetes bacterium]|nr:cation:proton antiporter [Candidatus Cloacimonadota bacterium]
MQDNLLLKLAIIIIFSKILGMIFKKLKQPPVIGMLLLGIILGPTLLDFIEPDNVILWIAMIGVLFLLFEAGLETDLKRIKSESRQAILPALGGVIMPCVMGFLFSLLAHHSFVESFILGIIITATSVSVSVMTLIDIGKLRGVEGRCIVNAAIIDDIVGILLLTVVFGLSTGQAAASGTLLGQLVKIVIFFVFVFISGIFLLKPIFHNLKKIFLDNVELSLAVAFVLFYSWFAEETGLAAITGAYFAGLFIGQSEYKHSIQQGISVLGKAFFVDVFFVSIGLGFNLFTLQAAPLYLIGFVLLALFSKGFGCWLGARFTGFDNIRSTRIGIGMLPRGEVALIIASMAVERKLIGIEIMSATILMVVVSAFITPIMLKASYNRLVRRGFKQGGIHVEEDN